MSPLRCGSTFPAMHDPDGAMRGHTLPTPECSLALYNTLHLRRKMNDTVTITGQCLSDHDEQGWVRSVYLSWTCPSTTSFGFLLPPIYTPHFSCRNPLSCMIFNTAVLAVIPPPFSTRRTQQGEIWQNLIARREFEIFETEDYSTYRSLYNTRQLPSPNDMVCAGVCETAYE
jgi:hypothetical protein